MPTIMLKKTFKIKPSGFKVANEKSFSFHGPKVDGNLIYAVNVELAKLHLVEGANKLKFKLQDDTQHYQAPMNHNFQKYHEEDAITIIIDVLEELGWDFRFEYDTEQSSNKGTGDSITKRELFLFHKPLPNKSNTTSVKKELTKLGSKSERITSSTRRSNNKGCDDDGSPPPPLQKMKHNSEKTSSSRKS